MKYKYNKKLGFFIRHSKTLSDRRVNLNSELKGENYGRNGSNGICFWDGRSACIHSFDKTNKDLKRKRNSRRELQGTVIHCSNSLSHGGISSTSDFALRNRHTYLSFVLNCRSDYLVAYPQKEQKTYKTKLSRMKITF